MSNEEIRKLAQKLTRMEGQIKGMQRPQLSYSVIEGGSLIAKDDEGNPRLIIGLQPDDTHAVVYVQGPTPPRPSAPVVSVDGVVLTVKHDGSNVGGVALPADYRRRIVYAGMAADLSDAQMVATIEPPQGGEAVFMSPGNGTVYVGVRTESHAGQLSDMSPVRSVEVTMISLEGEFEIIKQSADGKNSVNYAPTRPDGGKDGDVWFDTSVDPETGQPRWTLHVWDETAGAWVPAADSRLATLQSAQADLAKQLDAVVVSASGGNNNYHSADPPADSGELKAGDLWFDVDTNAPHRWDGKAWVSLADMRVQAIEKAQAELKKEIQAVGASADKKSTVWRQSSAPAGSHAVGDLWFNTSKSGLNMPHVWDGKTWVSVADSRVDAVEDAQSELNVSLEAVRRSADGKSTITWDTSAPGSTPGQAGDTWFRTSGSSIIGYWGHDGSGWVERTLDPVVIPNLDAGKITTGHLDAARIQAGSVTVDKLLIGSGTNLLVTDGWQHGLLPGILLYDGEAKLLDDKPGVRVRIDPAATNPRPYVFSFRRMAAQSNVAGGDFFPVKPGEKYRFTATLGLAGSYPDGATSLRILFHAYDGNGENLDAVKSPVGYASWAGIPFEATYTVPDGKLWLHVLVEMANARRGWITLENPKLELMVGSTLIEDGAITTEKIRAGAITAESGIIGSLDAGVITSGFLDTARLKAGSITTDMVLTGSGANLLPVSGLANGVLPGNTMGNYANALGFSGREGFYGAGVRLWADPMPEPGKAAAVFAFRRNNTGAGGIRGFGFPVTPGQRYRFSCFAGAGGTYSDGFTRFRVLFYYYTAEAAYVQGRGTPWQEVAWSRPVYATESVVPDTASWMQVYVQVDRPGVVELGDPALVLMTGSTLIEPGAITTDKLAAGSITADSGVVGSLDAGTITVGEMDGARLKANSVLADRLLVGSATNLLPELGTALSVGTPEARQPWAGFGVNAWHPSFWVKGDDQGARYVEHVFGLQAGVQYRLSLQVQSTVAGACFYVQLVPQNNGGADIAFDGTMASASYILPNQKTRGAGSFESFESVFTPRSDGVFKALIYPNHRNGADNSAGHMWFKHMRLEPLTGATLIADGAITTSKLAAGSVVADHMSVSSVDLGKAAFGELDGARIKVNTVGADHLTASAIDGKLITGATVQTNKTDPKTMLDATGFHITSEDGSDVVNLTADPAVGGDNYLGIQSPEGDMLASITNAGVFAGTSIDVPDLYVAGDQLLGQFQEYTHPAVPLGEDETPSWFDRVGWGLVAYGRDKVGGRTLGAAGGRQALIDCAFDAKRGRNYMITVEFPPVDVPKGTWMDYMVLFTKDGSRVTLDSAMLHKIPISNQSGGSQRYKQITTFIYPWYGADGVMSLMPIFQSGGPASTVDGYSCLVWVQDVGPIIEDTVNTRTDKANNDVPAPPPPPKPAKRIYTRRYRPTNGTAFYVSSGNKRTRDRHYFYQGKQPGTGDMRSLIMFPNMTGDLSGADILSMKAHYQFKHFYYGSGGTARLWFHDRLTTPDKLTNGSFKKLLSREKVPRGGSVTIDIPRSWWSDFKTGALRGMGFGNEKGTTTEYGYGYWDRCWIEIVYKK